MSYSNGKSQVLDCNVGITKIINTEGISFVFGKYDENAKISANFFNRTKSISVICESEYMPLSTTVTTLNPSLYANKINAIQTYVDDKDFSNKFIINELFTVVVSNEITENILNDANFKPISILVDSDRPLINSTGSSGNVGLKNFKITTQKDNYFEFILNITNASVIGITGLPIGIEYYKGALRGSPKISGNYYITVLLNDNSTIEGTIIVSELPRKI